MYLSTSNVVFVSIGTRSSSGSTNIAYQIKAHISQLFTLLFLSHNENETEIRYLRFNFNKELQADGKINRRTK